MLKVVFIAGLPGSGKGTQSALIAEQHGYRHINVGELIRQLLQGPSSVLASTIKQRLANGQLIPTETTCTLILEEMRRQPPVPGYVIDGYPRSLSNLDGWATITAQLPGPVNVLGTLLLEVDESTCITRCLNRRAGRPDDTTTTIRRRIVNHQQETQPLLDYLRNTQSLHRIDASRPPPTVFAEICSTLAKLEKHQDDLLGDCKPAN